MSELELKTEAEAPEFTDELSDEALDRTEGDLFCNWFQGCGWAFSAGSPSYCN